MGDFLLSSSSSSQPLTPEVLVPRLGDCLIEKGLINPAQLDEALVYQALMQSQGRKVLLGEVLITLGMIDRSMLDQAITEQIIQLRAALQESNQQLERRVQERTQELQNALEKLSELNQIKSNFIANISHELRTPLTHIKGYIELLATGSMGALNEQQMMAMQVVQRSTDRLEQQIEDLIHYSLASRGEFTLKFAPVNLQDLLEGVAMRNSEKASEKGLSLITNISVQTPQVVGDAEKLSWALIQLVDNAIKFTARGGEVSINTRPSGAYVEISVCDNGIGIPENRHAEIFEPFHQLDGSATRRYGGTGLGLALVKQIIEAHGSMIQLDSNLNHGSRFYFSLPASSKP